jgi:shikimate dehydrogenase
LEDYPDATPSDRTRRVLAGLLGRNIQLSRSPQMHESEADAQGVRLIYKLFDFEQLEKGEDDLEEFLLGLEAAGVAGINVTYPYKQAVIPLIGELSDSAERVGAVNTIAFRDGQRFGYNTDVTGFAESFRRGLPDVALAAVVQTGAGGAGAATAHAMLEMGANHIGLFDPVIERAEHLCEALRRAHGQDRASVIDNTEAAIRSADGLINASPVGMAEYPGSPVRIDALQPHQWVADIVYFPLETELVRGARQEGCQVLDGGGMAVYQAARAFEIFTGLQADGERMRARFLEQADEPSSSPISLATRRGRRQ